MDGNLNDMKDIPQITLSFHKFSKHPKIQDYSDFDFFHLSPHNQILSKQKKGP